MKNQAIDPNLNIIENIISASKGSEFYLSEDVYDQAGSKLLGKGYKITPDIKDKLISRVLKKPLETSISTETSLTADDLYSDAEELINNTLFLQSFNPELKLDLYELKQLEIAPLASLLLTVQKNNSKDAYEHTLFMTLTARLIARKLNIDSEQIYDLTIASLLHDIGELYCAIPDTRNLSLENWRNIMTHPIIGSSVVSQHMNYSPKVAQAILEHHERSDGSGYPNHFLADNLSDIGKVLIVAEAFSGIVRRHYDINNLITTLKLINHDYPTRQFGALIDLLYAVKGNDNTNISNPILENLLEQLKNLEEIMDLLKATYTNDNLKDFAEYLILRIRRVCQTIYASGLTDCIELGMWDNLKLDDEINRELYITINEVEWKMKDIYRDISIRIIKENLEISDELNFIISKIKGSEQELTASN